MAKSSGEIQRIYFMGYCLWVIMYQQVVIVMQTTLAVYDLSSKSLVEKVNFDSPSLMAPSFKSSGSDISGPSSVNSIAHSLRIYKGKLFLLVSVVNFILLRF